MLIYNVTVNVEDDINDEWVKWMKDIHIPEVLETGCFTHHYFTKVLTTQEDETGSTYSIQYHCVNSDSFNDYQNNHAPRLQKYLLERYPNKFVAFRTLLEKI